ncbi:hypothetical protein [Streptomyces sp. NBC_00371]|uniref:hypothetical protein n=1 Tax=Streptomyces sp. NBC_00371 TaxID=2975729 RepID=UPI002E2543DA
MTCSDDFPSPTGYEPGSATATTRPSRTSTSSRTATKQAEGIIAADFFHLDTVFGRRLYALVFIEQGTRRLHISGVTAHPTRWWAVQQARNVAINLGTRMESPSFLLRDRDGKYGQSFDAVFQAKKLEILKVGPRAPRMSTPCERVVGSIRRETLGPVLIVTGEAHTGRSWPPTNSTTTSTGHIGPETNYRPAPKSSLPLCTTPKAADSCVPASSVAHQRAPLHGLTRSDELPIPIRLVSHMRMAVQSNSQRRARILRVQEFRWCSQIA